MIRSNIVPRIHTQGRESRSQKCGLTMCPQIDRTDGILECDDSVAVGGAAPLSDGLFVQVLSRGSWRLKWRQLARVLMVMLWVWGSGPCIVVLRGSYTSLRSVDLLASMKRNSVVTEYRNVHVGLIRVDVSCDSLMAVCACSWMLVSSASPGKVRVASIVCS